MREKMNDENLKKTKGRPKGVKNKVNATIQQMLLDSLNNQGDIKWFDKLAVEEPKAYANLIAKLIPLQLIGGQAGEAPLSISVRYEKPKE